MRKNQKKITGLSDYQIFRQNRIKNQEPGTRNKELITLQNPGPASMVSMFAKSAGQSPLFARREGQGGESIKFQQPGTSCHGCPLTSFALSWLSTHFVRVN
jgi:hypothetical protein